MKTRLLRKLRKRHEERLCIHMLSNNKWAVHKLVIGTGGAKTFMMYGTSPVDTIEQATEQLIVAIRESILEDVRDIRIYFLRDLRTR